MTITTPQGWLDGQRHHPQRYREWGDNQLAAAVGDRDELAYGEICRRHSASLQTVASMILGRGPRCEDVVADVLIALWMTPAAFDPGLSSLLAYLRLTTRSRSIDLLRSESSRRRRQRLLLRLETTSSEAVDVGLLTDEASAKLVSALELLPAAERDPIRLAFYHAMSYRSVAAYLALPEGTVKSRIRTGLLHLRIALDPDFNSH